MPTFCASDISRRFSIADSSCSWRFFSSKADAASSAAFSCATASSLRDSWIVCKHGAAYRWVMNRWVMNRWVMNRWVMNRWVMNRWVMNRWVMYSIQVGDDAVLPTTCADPLYATSTPWLHGELWLLLSEASGTVLQ